MIDEMIIKQGHLHMQDMNSISMAAVIQAKIKDILKILTISARDCPAINWISIQFKQALPANGILITVPVCR